MSTFTAEQFEAMAADLDNASNWLRQGYGHFKDAAADYSRAPKQAVPMLRAAAKLVREREQARAASAPDGCMSLSQMAEDLQDIIDGERPKLNKSEMRDYVKSLLAASTSTNAEQDAQSASVPLIDRQRLISKIESWRPIFFDSNSDFDCGARYAIKQVVGKAMEGEFNAVLARSKEPKS